jgi:hypothetical protein
LALLSFLPLEQSRRIPVAPVYTWRIVQQLKAARGLIGYTLRAQLRQVILDALGVGE